MQHQHQAGSKQTRFAAAMLAIGMTLAGCGQGAQQGPPPLSVNAATAQRHDIATYITLDGQIAPLEQATLSFQQSGPISAIYVNVGDRVHAGQLLAQIDPSTLRAQLAQAEATASQASASARGSQIGLPVAQTSNVATLSASKGGLDNARLVYTQDQQLFKEGYVSQQQLEAARAAYVQAQSQYNTANAGIQNTAVTAQNVKASVAAAQAAEAQANVLRTELSQTTLYAPFDGVITARTMDPGAMAGPQAPALSISRIDTVFVNINVPDENLEYVHPGSTVTFRSATLPGKSFTGLISTVNAVPTQGTLSYLAQIHQPNPGGVLRGGMLVTITVQQARHDNAIVVPRTAISQDDTGTSVFVVKDGKAVQTPVKIGLQTDVLAEVISPQVTAGTQVITTLPATLQNGSVVAVNQNGGNAGK
jgi:multidrug efflux pump subunit AcrA (membrane-fusion protein)